MKGKIIHLSKQLKALRLEMEQLKQENESLRTQLEEYQ